jgi:hypothetical protein
VVSYWKILSSRDSKFVHKELGECYIKYINKDRLRLHVVNKYLYFVKMTI